MAITFTEDIPTAVEQGGIVISWNFSCKGVDDKTKKTASYRIKHDLPMIDRKPFNKYTQAEVGLLMTRVLTLNTAHVRITDKITALNNPPKTLSAKKFSTLSVL